MRGFDGIRLQKGGRAQQLYENELEYVKAHIRARPGKIYYQIPFTVVKATSVVVDLCSRVEVVSQLRDITDKGNADLCWA